MPCSVSIGLRRMTFLQNDTDSLKEVEWRTQWEGSPHLSAPGQCYCSHTAPIGKTANKWKAKHNIMIAKLTTFTK